MNYIKKVLIYKTNNLNLDKLYFTTNSMAKSRYEYVKAFEMEDKILPNVWIVVRVDGRGFHKFCKVHNFVKPNDFNGLNLMNMAGISVMREFPDITISYGQSDEYSFVFHKSSQLYNRRHSKILTYVNSLFTAAYVYNWPSFFPDKKLQYAPCFDARIVIYPSDENLRDYLSWRQADVHINNLYNTVFWNLVLNDNKSNAEAEEILRGTLAADKNEILFTKFGINYNTITPMFRKGTILLKKKIKLPHKPGTQHLIIPIYEDLIQEKFWKKHFELLGKKTNDIYDYSLNLSDDSKDTGDTDKIEPPFRVKGKGDIMSNTVYRHKYYRDYLRSRSQSKLL